MPHVFFFSYASENFDKELRAFFEDLCSEVAPYTPWSPKDSRISFRDGTSLPLMEEWKPTILEALQSSAVLVCITSTAYLNKPFCGQEYWIFDKRRHQKLAPKDHVPATILPIIWAPVAGELPACIDSIQWQEGTMPIAYQEKGLRYLKKLDPNGYDRCVTAFADAIRLAWQRYPAVPRLPILSPFGEIPNAFAGGQWEEAVGPEGWIPGPGVANFVFAAGLDAHFQRPPGRYGPTAAEWRPYLPPSARTASEIAKSVAKKNQFRYRELLVNVDLPNELRAATARKNLTLVLADPQTLSLASHNAVRAFDSLTWEGNAVLMPWDCVLGPWEDVTLQASVSKTFPIMSQLGVPRFQAPISSVDDLETLLDTTLADLRGVLTRSETERKDKTDVGPPSIIGSGGS